MYVFLMDKGQLVYLDLNLSNETASSLQLALNHEFGLPVDKQILLVSGGFQIDSEDKLPQDGGGMDRTNPIYVFTRGEAHLKPDSLKVDAYYGYPSQIQSLLSARAGLPALTERLLAVQALRPGALEAYKAIEQLVLEQRQLIQGWHAAVANLDEVVTRMTKNLAQATSSAMRFESCAADWGKRLASIQDLKTELSGVPLLHQLSHQLNSTFCCQKDSLGIPELQSPSNLYEWVCLQSNLSSGGSRLRPTDLSGRSAASRLQLTAYYLNRPDLYQRAAGITTGQPPLASGLTGRCRTTSAGANLCVGQPVTSTAAWQTPTGRPSTAVSTHSSWVNLTAGGGTPGRSTPVMSAGNSPGPLVGDPYELAFLAMVNCAQNDLRLLCAGPEEAKVDRLASPTGVTGQPLVMAYLHSQIARLSRLLAVVTSCSERLHLASSILTPTLHEAVPGASEPMPAALLGNPLALHSSSSAPDLAEMTHRALDRTVFSHQLAQLNPLVENANQLLELINATERDLAEVHDHAVKIGDTSVVVGNFEKHTIQLQRLLTAFRTLCEILDCALRHKHNLINHIWKRQQWLHNFQSEVIRLDVTVTNCLRLASRVTNTTTVLTQLQRAPWVYVHCLVEIVRQQEFDSSFADVCRELSNHRRDEATRRRIFAKEIKDHVLHMLFSSWPGLRSDRSTLTRGWCYPDLTEDTGTPESVPTRHVSIIGNYDQHQLSSRSSGLCRSQRTSSSSQSEPRLNELIGTAGSPVPMGGAFQPKGSSSGRQKLAQVHEDDADSKATPTATMREPTAADSNVPAAQTLVRLRNLSTTDLCSHPLSRGRPLLQRPHSSGTEVETGLLRGASMPNSSSCASDSDPVDGGDPVVKWNVGFADQRSQQPRPTPPPPVPQQQQQEFSTVSTISRDDLLRLSASLPEPLAGRLREELTQLTYPRFSVVDSRSAGSGTTNLLRATEHIGLSPPSPPPASASAPAEDVQTATSMGTSGATMEPPAGGTLTAECQTEPLLLFGANQHQPQPQFVNWSTRSRSTSLNLPVDDSSLRRPVGWEPLPSSVCSWELCHHYGTGHGTALTETAPLVTGKRSASSTALSTCLPSALLVTTGTQTDESSFRGGAACGAGAATAHSSGGPTDRERLVACQETGDNHLEARRLTGNWLQSLDDSSMVFEQQQPVDSRSLGGRESGESGLDAECVSSVHNDLPICSPSMVDTDEAAGGAITSGQPSPRQRISNRSDSYHTPHGELSLPNLSLISLTSGTGDDLLLSPGDPRPGAEKGSEDTGLSCSFHSTKTCFSESGLPTAQLQQPSADGALRSVSRLSAVGQRLSHSERGLSGSLGGRTSPLGDCQATSLQSASRLRSLSVDCLHCEERLDQPRDQSSSDPGVPSCACNRLYLIFLNLVQDCFSNECACLLDDSLASDCLKTFLTRCQCRSMVDVVQMKKLVQMLQTAAAFLRGHPDPPCRLHGTKVTAKQAPTPTGSHCSKEIQVYEPCSCVQPQVSVSAATQTLTRPPELIDGVGEFIAAAGTLVERSACRLQEVAGGNEVEETASAAAAAPTPEDGQQDLQSLCASVAMLVSDCTEDSLALHRPPLPDLCVSMSGSSAAASDPVSPLQFRPQAPVTQRRVNFVHAHFAYKDIVVFVPVRPMGVTGPLTGDQKAVSAGQPAGDKLRSRRPAAISSRALASDGTGSGSFSSTRLSTSIIETMPNGRVDLPPPSRRGGRIAGRDSPSGNTSMIASMLVSDSTEGWLASDSNGQTRPRSVAATTPLASSTATVDSPVTQWRMLSSDGHFYFLHQDDFGLLNLSNSGDWLESPNESALATGTLVAARHHQTSRQMKRNGGGGSSGEGGEAGKSRTEPKLARDEQKCFIIAHYLRKELCISKRAGNRFNLPKDYTFYRVRAKPLNQPASDLLTTLAVATSSTRQLSPVLPSAM